ncbi:MAG: hypothetical protein WA951_09980, partial [Leeuwenhoekiella sp.]
MRPPSLRTLCLVLFLLGLFFIPFNSYKGIPMLGEYSKESATLFFLLGTGVLAVTVLVSKRITFPIKNAVFCAVLIFLGWSLLTFFLNIGTIKEYSFKGITGGERFFRQFLSLLIIALFFLVFFINTLAKLNAATMLKRIRQIFLASLIIVAIYGVLETLIVVFGLYQLLPILH